MPRRDSKLGLSEILHWILALLGAADAASMQQLVLLALQESQLLRDLTVLLPNNVVITVHQKVHELSVLLIHAVGEVARHEIAVEGLCVAALRLLPPFSLLVNTPAAVVGRAIGWLLGRLLVTVSVSVAPWSTRFSRRPRLPTLPWLALDGDLPSELDIELPLKLELELEIVVLFDVGVSRHAQILQGKVSLLVDMPVMVLRDLRRRQVVLWPLSLPSLLSPRGPGLVELLDSGGTHRKVLCLRGVLRPVVGVLEELSVLTIRNHGPARVLNCVLCSGVRVCGGTKVLVLDLTVYVYDILVLVELLDL